MALPQKIEILPKISVIENDNSISKDLIVDSVVDNKITFKKEVGRINELDLTFDEDITKLDIDFLKLGQKTEKTTALEIDDNGETTFIDNSDFDDYKIIVGKSLIALENVTMLNDKSLISSTNVDTLVLDNKIVNVKSKSLADNMYTYTFDEQISIKSSFYGFNIDSITRMIDGIHPKPLEIVKTYLENVTNNLEINYHLENKDEEPWVGYTAKVLLKLVSINNFKYIDSSTFTSSDKLKKYQIISNISNHNFFIDSVTKIDNDNYRYTVDGTSKLNNIFDETQGLNLDRWSNKDTTNQEGNIVHLLTNFKSKKSEIDLNPIIDSIDSVSVKMRVYSIGVWDDSVEDKVYVKQNNVTKWESLRNGILKWQWHSGRYSCQGWYTPITDSCGDWTQYYDGDIGSKYRDYKCGGYFCDEIKYIGTKTLNLKGYKDIEILVDKSELVNNIFNLEIGSELHRDYSMVSPQNSNYGGCAAGFGNLEITVNVNSENSKTLLEKAPTNIITISNHQNIANVLDHNIVVTTDISYPNVEQTYKYIKQIGDFYDIKVQKENEDSFQKITLITKSKY